MATFEIIEGKPGQGKSLYTSRLARKLLKRNKAYFKKTNVVRPIYSNIKFSPKFEQEGKITVRRKFKNGNVDRTVHNFIHYWSNINEIVKLENVDLLWDEIATELDSRNFSNLSDELKRFLSQYRKRGIDIYANTQDFSMIDMRARLMITRVATLGKLMGSPDPSPTKPPVKKIWGLVVVRDVENILTDDPHNKKYNIIPSFFFIDREDIEIYDTTQDIPLSPPLPFRHIVRECEHKDDPDHDCSFHKTIHA